MFRVWGSGLWDEGARFRVGWFPFTRVCIVRFWSHVQGLARKVDARLPGKGNSNSQGARPVHQMISMTKWMRTSRLSTKNSLVTGYGWGKKARSKYVK